MVGTLHLSNCFVDNNVLQTGSSSANRSVGTGVDLPRVWVKRSREVRACLAFDQKSSIRLNEFEASVGSAGSRS
jgi:hypothetical protein